jgi:N-formylglutamate deformylase
MNPYVVEQGDSPVILGMPHVGTDIEDGIWQRLNDLGRERADTDWWIDRLYGGLLPNATVVRATFSRYVVDANRDPSGKSLYPGQNTTDVCPTKAFDGEPIYQPGQKPSGDEIAERVSRYHAPYHAALAAEIERVRARHGVAVLYDCHSIRSDIPYLFEGRLPTFNIGTNDGVTCDAKIEAALANACSQAHSFSHVLNGRFKGGWTTRHYGQPADGVHAIQLEMAQAAYMLEEAPWTYLPERADQVRPILKGALAEMERLALSGALNASGK